jgi:ParB family chromosome partitioning protein
MKRQALGKGLDALLPQLPIASEVNLDSALLELHLEQIHPNALQPRLAFEPDKLEELAASIKENGVIQPIVVRPVGGGYEIVAGERRWRAAQKAGLTRIPAVVQEVSDQKMLEMALVENIQRDDLSPVEEAHAYQLLLDQFGLTQEQVAQRVGRSRTAVTNTLRLLRLPSAIQKEVIHGTLSMGHARALINVEIGACLELGRRCVEEGMTVRELEQAVKQLSLKDGPDRDNGKRGKPSPQGRRRNDPIIDSYEEKLRHRFATAVDIRRSAKKGRVEIEFYDDDDLDRILELLLADDY